VGFLFEPLKSGGYSPGFGPHPVPSTLGVHNAGYVTYPLDLGFRICNISAAVTERRKT
jgi:hypothetical protein